MTLPSLARTPCLRCRFIGEPAMVTHVADGKCGLKGRFSEALTLLARV